MKVSLEQLGKRFHHVTALREVSLQLEPGLIVLMGDNGAGKTTLLECLAGILVPTEGRILYDGQPLRRDDLTLMQRIHLVPDMLRMPAQFTPLEYIAMAVHVYGRTPDPELQNRLVQWIEATRMTLVANTPLTRLSRGQQYKAALLSLLAVDPDLWLLDEPFAAGMDPWGVAVLREEIVNAARRGRVVIYTTQLPEIAEQLADRFLVLSKGRLAASGTLDQLRGQFGQPDQATLADVFAGIHHG
jgi:ABC-2 type transport system ATP-binding protein